MAYFDLLTLLPALAAKVAGTRITRSRVVFSTANEITTVVRDSL
jgi:hypothetical protein